MSVGEDIVNASTHIQDKEAFIQGLNTISDELGISRDYLPIIMVTETGVDGTINPAANNGNCGGLIQFCNGPNAGAEEVGVDADTISNMSAVEQLPLIRQYLSTKGIPKGADLATAYLSILYPVAMDASRGENLGYIPPQSEHLYGPDGSLSKETIEAGLLSKAKAGGAGLSSPSVSGDKPFSALPNKATPVASAQSGAASLGTNNGAVIIGTYTRDCTKTPPWDWTMQGGKIYRGCALRITTLGIQGGMSSTPMVGAMTTSTTKATVMVSNTSMGPGPGGKPVTPPKPGTLLNPVPGSPESSGYGMRMHPIHGTMKMHNGTDISAAEGTPIIAPMDGVIAEVGNDAAGYGQWLSVKHSDGSIGETFYAHMSAYADLPVGTQVKAGQTIGYVGNTGGSTGAHLHFEVRDPNGQLMDPNSVMQR